MFWPLRFALVLVALVSPAVNWRIGMVMVFSLTADFVTYIWMTLPLFSVASELLAVCGTGVFVGAVIVAGSRRLSWWMAPVIALVVLAALRGALYLSGLASEVLSGDDVLRTLPGSVALVLGGPAALLAPALIVRLVGRRARMSNPT